MLNSDLDQRSRSKVKTAKLPYFLELIEVTFTKFSTKVICDNGLHNISHVSLMGFALLVLCSKFSSYDSLSVELNLIPE